MNSEFGKRQRQIDALISQMGDLTKTERLAALAQQGVEEPESLVPLEIQKICDALLVHYAQMGIE